MKVEKTSLEGCYIITPKIFKDERGEFLETFHNKKFNDLAGVKTKFIQDNLSISKKGVLRGLHYQKGKFSQAKLVSVVEGEILDVCVDLRKNSNTFGEHFSIILNSDERKQIYIPRGFAHGFLTLSDVAIFSYKCDNYYNKESERGIIYNDSNLNINWGINEKDLVLSAKDRELPTFKSLK